MLVGAVMGFWAVQRIGGPGGTRSPRGRRRRARRRCRGADPRLPRDHAAGEPDRLGARVDDLRGCGRSLVVSRQRPRAGRRPGEARVRARRPVRAADVPVPRADRVRADLARLRVVGLRRRSSSSTSPAPGPALNVRAVGESPQRPTRWGSTSPRTATRTRSPGGAFAGVGGACFSLAITPQWVDGLTGGAGWIAIALVIFAFWRPELCLVGAYFFGAFQALPFTLQARGVTVRPRALPGAPLRDDHRRARARLLGDSSKRRLGAPGALGAPVRARGALADGRSHPAQPRRGAAA